MMIFSLNIIKMFKISDINNFNVWFCMEFKTIIETDEKRI